MGRQNRFAEDKRQRKNERKRKNPLLLVVAQNRGRQFNLFCGDMYKAQYQASQKWDFCQQLEFCRWSMIRSCFSTPTLDFWPAVNCRELGYFPDHPFCCCEYWHCHKGEGGHFTYPSNWGNVGLQFFHICSSFELYTPKYSKRWQSTVWPPSPPNFFASKRLFWSHVLRSRQ